MKLRNITGIKLPEGKTDHTEFVDELPNFGLRLRKSSERVIRRWVVVKRLHGIQRTWLIGSPDVLTPEQAHTAAKKALAKITLGIDPSAEKAAAKEAARNKKAKADVTMKVVVDAFLDAKKARVRARTYVELERYLAGPKYLRPLHGTPIDQITRKDIAASLLRITKTNGPIPADRCRTALSSLFGWALGEGLADSNPVIGTNKPQQPEARARVLSDEELRAVWNGCAGNSPYNAVVKLLILSGCRREEVGGMRWSELDLHNGTWSLPKERCKNNRAHALPLTSLALSIIASVPRRDGIDHLFGKRGFTGWSARKAELDEKLAGKITDEWHLHDLRRTAATRMADLGVEPHHIEAVLNHYSGHRAGVSGVYNRSPYANQIKQALALWSDHVQALVEGSEPRIVAFPHVGVASS